MQMNRMEHDLWVRAVDELYWFWCGVSGLQVVEDMDFCSYGERRTDEQ